MIESCVKMLSGFVLFCFYKLGVACVALKVQNSAFKKEKALVSLTLNFLLKLAKKRRNFGGRHEEKRK
jgi:hypothetical protein